MWVSRLGIPVSTKSMHLPSGEEMNAVKQEENEVIARGSVSPHLKNTGETHWFLEGVQTCHCHPTPNRDAGRPIGNYHQNIKHGNLRSGFVQGFFWAGWCRTSSPPSSPLGGEGGISPFPHPFPVASSKVLALQC